MQVRDGGTYFTLTEEGGRGKGGEGGGGEKGAREGVRKGGWGLVNER